MKFLVSLEDDSYEMSSLIFFENYQNVVCCFCDWILKGYLKKKIKKS